MTRPGQFVRARILLVPLALAVVGCSLLLLGCSRLEQKTPFQQGSSAYDNGDYDKALADFNQAIQLDPKYAGAYDNRVKAYKVKGEKGARHLLDNGSLQP